MAAIAGSAVGGAVVAFLISWAVIGSDSSADRAPTSSGGAAVQEQVPGLAQGGVPTAPDQSASGSTGQGAAPSQGRSGAMPSARSGAS